MAWVLRMPEVAANATEAVLADWSVAERESFAARDVIATVETEKAVVDVEADDGGVLLRTLVSPGSSVDVGSPIAVLAAEGEQVGDVDALLAELGVEAGGGTSGPERRGVAERPVAAGDGTSGPERRGVAERPVTGRIFTSPLARRLAREAGIAIEEIAGTGPHGRILRRDVEAAVASRTNGTARAVAVPEAPVAVQPAPESAPHAGGFSDVPHSRMRRAIAGRLSESKQTVPHFYLRATVRVDRLLKLRGRINADAAVRVSVNDLVVKAVAAAHLRVPEMNVVWTEDAVRRFESVDVAVAVATESGLVTPVVRGVEQRSITSVAEATRDLAERARDGKLRQDEIEGGTIAVTNLGMYGVEEFTAIINPPHSGILAVGAAREEPVVHKGRLRAATVMHLTLSADHRPVDGVIAARWMAELVALLENPVRVLT